MSVRARVLVIERMYSRRILRKPVDSEELVYRRGLENGCFWTHMPKGDRREPLRN